MHPVCLAQNMSKQSWPYVCLGINGQLEHRKVFMEVLLLVNKEQVFLNLLGFHRWPKPSLLGLNPLRCGKQLPSIPSSCSEEPPGFGIAALFRRLRRGEDYCTWE